MTENVTQPPPPPAYGQMGPTPPPFTPEPAPVKKNRKWVLPVVLLTAGMIFGFSAGSATVPDPVVETKVETKTVTETETVEVEVTPPSCIEALDLAAEAMGIMGKVFPLAGDAITAAGNRDADGLDAVTAKMTVINQDMEDAAPPMGVAVSACRALAK